VSAEAAPVQQPGVFSARTVLVLVLVSLFAFSAFVVLATYAPDLKEKEDVGAHALSRSAVGFAGAVALLRAEGVPVVVSRAKDLKTTQASLVVLTPGPANGAEDLERLASENLTLVVLPKWPPVRNPLHPGWVLKMDPVDADAMTKRLLGKVALQTQIVRRDGVRPAALRLAPGVDAFTPEGQRIDFGVLASGPIDRLQTISGEGWRPMVVDEQGRAVLATSPAHPNLIILSDPDLLNTQGVADINTARVASALVEVLRDSRDGVVFDVTLQGFGRSRSLGKLLLEPPLLGATLCAVAAALLMGAHAVARFGPTPPSARAFALGAKGLVDNSAGLVRMAGREAELARPYAALAEAQVLKATGAGSAPDRLDRLEAHGRISVRRRELAAVTDAVKTPDDLLAAARRWRQWRLEMTRDRR
jgi:hypothetical protein